MINYRLFCTLFCALFVAVHPAAFGSVDCVLPGELSPKLQHWVELYDSGWHGDDDALRRFFETADSYEEEWERVPFLRAVYGSACIAHARLVSNFQKPRWLRRGAKHLNAAVGEAPEEVGPRLLRASSFAVLPRRAGQMETVRDDFVRLVKRAKKDDLSEQCRQRIFYHAGAFALRDRDPQALPLLRLAAELDPEEGLEREQLLRMLRSAEQMKLDR